MLHLSCRTYCNQRLCFWNRYEDLKQQLLAAQNLAEQEGDQEQLARAAAAVARLTFPSGNVDTSSRPSATVSLSLLISTSVLCLCARTHHSVQCTYSGKFLD